MIRKGIDVSTWQKNINWDLVKNSGIEFAMVRSGYGRGGDNQIDDKFASHINSAKKAGLYVGAYHYSYAESEADAITEAEFCLSIIKDYKFDYPIAFDIEDNSMKKLPKKELTKICKAFCDKIEDNGYYACIYANPDWLNNYLDSNELLDKYDLWLADWNTEKPSFDCGIWQYSDSGNIPGIEGNVDINISYKDYPYIIKAKGLNKQNPPIANSQSANSFVSYTVKSGDTLSQIAARYNTTSAYLADINNISNPDIIYVGQKIIIPSCNNNCKNCIMYTVVSNDTLWGIAKTYLNDGARYTEIKSLNNLISDTIYPGQVLKIPNKAGC